MSRKATHSGSWYSSSAKELNKDLSNWLSSPGLSSSNPVRAIIAPHAGYSYCGSCAAYAYKQIDPEPIKRVFILGPSHHVYMTNCALSSVKTYETPLQNLTIDQQVYQELKSTGLFDEMSLTTDEDEHSIEMHLPYIAKVFEKNKHFKIIPILVGSLSRDSEIVYGKLLSKYLCDPENLFVISSDFCHWGQRFRYTYYDESKGGIHKSIEHLDRCGMELIEKLKAKDFHDYLKKYKNTICGRHPIAVLLNAIEELVQINNRTISFNFLNYKQSSKCKDQHDSSVSYAAGILEMS